MQHRTSWHESKFTIEGNAIRATRDPQELARSSRLPADLVGAFYSRAIPEWVSGDLADLGCGKAPLYAAYSRHCSTVLLADWANSLHENPLLDLIIDLNQPLTSIESDSLDVVILSDVLEHIREPAALVQEISRILRPGGRLLLNVPFLYQLHEEPYDYFRYTRYALEQFATQSGLEVIELVPLGGWVEVAADLTSKLLARAKLWPIIATLHRAVIVFNRTGVGRKIANTSGVKFPIGYGMIAIKKAPPSQLKDDVHGRRL